MAAYEVYYKTKSSESQSGRIEQLLQLLRITWDGDLVNKTERDILVKLGMANTVYGGFNIITAKGIKYLFELGFIHP